MLTEADRLMVSKQKRTSNAMFASRIPIVGLGSGRSCSALHAAIYIHDDELLIHQEMLIFTHQTLFRLGFVI